MNTKELQRPSQDLAQRILSEVGFEDRLVGYRTHRRLGPSPVALYSYGEVVGFLSEQFPQIKINKLEAWLRDTMGDTEMADKVRMLRDHDLSDQERLLQIRNLMGLRLLQCGRTV